MAVLSWTFLIAVMALLLSALSIQAAVPEAAPAPAPIAAAGLISPSFGSTCLAAVVAFFFVKGLKI